MTKQEKSELQELREEVAALREQVRDLENAVVGLKSAMMFWQVMPPVQPQTLPLPRNPPWFAPQIEKQTLESIGEVYCHR